MTTPDDNRHNLEEFLADEEGADKAEIARQLRLLGVDANQFFSRIKKTVQDGYCAQMRELAEREKEQQVTRPAFLAHVQAMSREAMLAVFQQIQSGAFGGAYREAAIARCRNKSESQFSDDELRSWLEDIGDILGEPPNES